MYAPCNEWRWHQTGYDVIIKPKSSAQVGVESVLPLILVVPVSSDVFEEEPTKIFQVTISHIRERKKKSLKQSDISKPWKKAKLQKWNRNYLCEAVRCVFKAFNGRGLKLKVKDMFCSLTELSWTNEYNAWKKF